MHLLIFVLASRTYVYTVHSGGVTNLFVLDVAKLLLPFSPFARFLKKLICSPLSEAILLYEALEGNYCTLQYHTTSLQLYTYYVHISNYIATQSYKL